MSVNGITTNTGLTTAKTYTAKKTDTTKNSNKTEYSEAAVYEKSDETVAAPKVNNKVDSETIARLKADAEERTASLRSLVERMMTKQGKTVAESGVLDFENGTNLAEIFKNLEVDEETRLQAQKDTAEDGYWGAEQTSERILEFAKGLAGDDPKLAQDMLNAIKQGFEEAGKAWGEDLPGLCRDIENKGKRACLSLPHIMRHGRDRWNELCEKIPWQAVYVHNINEAYWLAGLAGYQGERIGSASFYQWNTGSLETARSLTRLDAFQLPLEYDAADCRKLVEAIRSRGSMPAPELLVYGRVPLMVTAQCQKKNAGRCDQVNGLTVLTDSRGRKLPVSSHCACCYNKIWSHEPADRTGRDYDSLLPYVDRTAFDFFLADPGLPDLIADRCRRWQKKEYSLC